MSRPWRGWPVPLTRFAVGEDGGDLGVGVLVEELVDGGDDVGWGLA
jgi:hypothetical protein